MGTDAGIAAERNPGAGGTAAPPPLSVLQPLQLLAVATAGAAALCGAVALGRAAAGYANPPRWGAVLGCLAVVVAYGLWRRTCGRAGGVDPFVRRLAPAAACLWTMAFAVARPDAAGVLAATATIGLILWGERPRHDANGEPNAADGVLSNESNAADACDEGSAEPADELTDEEAAEFAEDESAEPAGEPPRMLLIHRIENGRAVWEGRLRCGLAAGATIAAVHAAFCPAFEGVPELEWHQLEGPPVRIRPSTVLPQGVRFEVRPTAVPTEPVEIEWVFLARAPATAIRAA